MELVSDLLDLAATRSVVSEEALEPVALQPALQQVLDRLSVEAETKKQVVTVEAPEETLVVQATPKGLGTVFSNVLGNAIKYTPEGGRIQVRMRRQNGQVLVSIADTGLGIPADALPRIGEEFFRAENARQSQVIGTGLGLSIVQELMGNFGGSMAVDSVEGQGTTVNLRLPAAAPETAPAQNQPAPAGR
jgi:signal transduction histidine kinase